MSQEKEHWKIGSEREDVSVLRKDRSITLKTADGDTYEYCASATGLTYKGKSAGAEEGNWSLKKR